MKQSLGAIAIAIAACVAVHAQAACTKAEIAKAEKAVDAVATWPQMQKTITQWKQCDAGSVDALFTETLIRMLVDWKNLDALENAMKDADFKAFVVKHLQSPEAKDDVQMVYSRAKASCPASREALCAEFVDMTKASSK